MDFIAAWRRAIKNTLPFCNETPPPTSLSKERAKISLTMLRSADTQGRVNLWLIIVALLLTLVSWLLAPKTHAEVVNKIAAVVNNEIITEVELSHAQALHSKEAIKSKANTKQEALDRLIDDKLFAQIMTKSKIEVTEDDIAKAIANVLHQNRMGVDELRNELASKGISYEEYKKQIENEIRRIKFVNQVISPQVKITDQDLRDYYQQNQDRFHGSSQAHIAEIVLPLAGLATEADYKTLSDTALAIVAKARKGASFDALAKQYSKGPNAAQGGDLGMMSLKDLQPEVSATIRNLKIGEVSNPILAGNAVVIVKLIALPEIAVGNFDKMRDQMYSILHEQKIEETLANYMQKERSKAFIEIR